VIAGGRSFDALTAAATGKARSSSVMRRVDGTTSDTEYDTIRDASLTCARKPTRVGLIYRTEPTTKKCKTEKLESKRTDMLRSNSKSLGDHVVSPEEKKERLQGERFAEKESFKHGMKE